VQVVCLRRALVDDEEMTAQMGQRPGDGGGALRRAQCGGFHRLRRPGVDVGTGGGSNVYADRGEHGDVGARNSAYRSDRRPFVAGPVTSAGQLILHNEVAFNAMFATVQLALGLGLMWRLAVRAALAGTIVWALSIWWLGEGLGGIFTSTASPVTGHLARKSCTR
jgi:hypothetical protein